MYSCTSRVRVPAGIGVGGADSLPGASIGGAAGQPTYVDLVAASLAELDALVAAGIEADDASDARRTLAELTSDDPNNPDKSFVKRVIAAEGDRVRIVEGKVFVDDEQVDDSFVPPQYRSHDDWGPEVVPQGYYFVMGDHRNNSSDSRHWGMVPKKYIIGKVQLRWWPIPNARVF